MSKDEYLEFITHQPYDAMGDFSFLLDEKSDKAENTTIENDNKTGKQYKSHYLTIIQWAKKDAAKQASAPQPAKSGFEDYSFKKGQSY